MSIQDKLLKAAAGDAPGGITPSENFNVVTYTGTGSTQSITGVGFKPDFVWTKARSASNSHALYDSTRGVNKELNSNSTDAQGSLSDGISSFDSDGFTVGSRANSNASGVTYVAWCWKANGGTTSSNTDGSITGTVQANTDAGFSIVQYDSSGNSSGTIGHGLGVKPGLAINKNIDSGSTVWVVNTDVIDGSDDYLILNSTAAKGDAYTAPTATTIGSIDYATNDTVISYCFASIDGFSKIGIYTGNGSTDGPIVETGFEPAFLMIKRTDSTSDFGIWDNKKTTSNPRNIKLNANDNSADSGPNTLLNIDFLSNGFQITNSNSNTNASGGTFIYMAFAADPDTEAPTLADSFAVETYTGTGSAQSITGFGFKPNLLYIKRRSGASGPNMTNSILGIDYYMFTDSTSNFGSDVNHLGSFDNDGFTTAGGGNAVNGSGEDYVVWAWKADDNEPTLFGGPAKAVYKFEDNLNDVTGNNNSNASASITYNSSGKFNKSVDFNGTSSYFTVSSLNNLFDTWTSISYSLWIKTTDSSAQFLVGTATDEQNYKALASISSGKLTPVTRKSGTVYSASSSTSINDGNWHHIVITYDNDNGITKGYVDGVEEVSFATGGSSSGSLTIHNVSVGANYQSGNGNFYNGLDGEIDQLRFYNGVINDIGVAALYAETASDNDDLTLGAPKETIISANANAGFSIVKYEGDGTANKRIPHGLSSAPELIIAKPFITSSWVVYTATTGTDKFFELNTDAAEQTASNYWGTSNPSATTFGVAQSNANNNSTGNEIIAYCFHSVSGYSKIGTYTGSGSSGNAQNIGFQPDFVMIKSRAQYNWNIYDSKRPSGSITGRYMLLANASDSEYTTSVVHIDLTSTGFSFPNAYDGTNKSGQDYVYMAFKMNKTIYPTSGNMSFLVIAGGGGAGGSDGGGGGAGGLRTSYRPTSGGGSSSESDITLAAGTYTITVGAAGTGGAGYSTTTPTSGADSSIAASGLTTITSTGGGRGGMYNHINGYPESGGSGGGGGGETGMAGFAGTANQGFAGESEDGSAGTYHAGGGGGAAEAGGTDGAGQGGDGLSVSITGSAVTYAGGGAGGGLSGTNQGGDGGGGNSGIGSGSVNGSAGSTNTGSGGGGGADGSSSQGGAGGSGVVILRLLTSEYSGSTTGSPTVTTDGDYTIIKYTGSGTYVHS